MDRSPPSPTIKLQPGILGAVPWAVIELRRVYPLLEIWRRPAPGQP